MTVREYNIVCLLIDKNIKDDGEKAALKSDLVELAGCYIPEKGSIQMWEMDKSIEYIEKLKQAKKL